MQVSSSEPHAILSGNQTSFKSADFKEILDSEKDQLCPASYVLALTDTLNVINGKWKLSIIACLLRGVTCFKDLLERTEKIIPRMLSKELKELELNGIVERKSI